MASSEVLPANATESDILKSGFLYKQGGAYRSWKKRYFVLCDSSLCYYKKESDTNPKGTIDLATGRGVRTKKQCVAVEDWPKDAKKEVTFGLSVESRTYYLYGSEKENIEEWKTLLQQRIQQIGKPTNAYEDDPEGKPESVSSKLAKSGAKMVSKVTKLVLRNAPVDPEVVDVAEGVAEAAENQADAGRDATLGDRLKMATGDAAGIVGDNVDNQYVSTAASVVQEQAEADGDMSLQQRVLMSTGTVLEGAGEIVGEENEIAGAAVGAVGGVVKDQAEADEDMSLKQRLVLAGGSALSEGGGVIADATGSQVAGDVLEVAGGVVKDQAEADEDLSIKQRAALAVGSTAGGVADLDSMRYNYAVKEVCREVESVAEVIQDELAVKADGK